MLSHSKKIFYGFTIAYYFSNNSKYPAQDSTSKQKIEPSEAQGVTTKYKIKHKLADTVVVGRASILNQ